MSSKRKNRLKVSGGSCRGRFVQFAENPQLRPTTERSREAIFSILENLQVVSDAICLDLYAGSGILGIEALSRGASEAHFVESSRKSSRAIEENLQLLSFSEQARVWSQSVESFMSTASIGQPIDLILADPPYDFIFGEEQLAPLVKRGLCAERLHLVVERRRVSESAAQESLPYLLGSSGEEPILFSSYALVSRQLRTYGDSEFEIVELKK